jgi:RNA polymerase sigma-B factor
MTAVLLTSAVVTVRPDHAEDTVPRSATTEHLLRRRDELPRGDPDRDVVRDRVIDDNLPLARRLARRYAGRGEPLEDLTQVAVLALVKAVDKYDTSRDSRFVSYAIPCILGALKRHFRDTGWGLRVSRAVQELVLLVRATSGDLGHRLGRPPTSAELAEYLDVTVDQLLTAQAAVFAYRPGSLDVPVTRVDGVGAADLVKALGRTEPRYDAVDDRLTIRALVASLPERDRRIVTMRFFDGMTQTQIAAAIGISQMQVSRLLRQCLDRLHLAMTSDRARS